MNVRNMPSGMLMVNTYLVTDEETKKGFIVDPGGFDKRLCNVVQKDGIEIEYIADQIGRASCRERV